MKNETHHLCHPRYHHRRDDDGGRGDGACSDPGAGHAVVSRLNTSLLGVIYGGNARKVLRSGIAPEQEALVSLLADGIRKEKAQQKETEP